MIPLRPELIVTTLGIMPNETIMITYISYSEVA